MPTVAPGLIAYYSDTYGFRLTLPAHGTVVDVGASGIRPGECGGAIAERDVSGMHGVLVDNLLFIQILPWKGSIRAYFDATEPQAEWIDRLYALESVHGANADEAVLPVRKAGVTPPPGSLPLGYVAAAYRKGGRLFVLRPLQAALTSGGCVADSPQTLPQIAASVVFAG